MRKGIAVTAVAVLAVLGAPVFADSGNHRADNDNSATRHSSSANYSDWWNASSGVWGEAWQVRRQITRAEAEAFIVTNAVPLYNSGCDALQNGNENQARQDFAKAMEALKEEGFMPVESITSWANYNQVTGGDRVYWTEYRQLRREITQARSRGVDVGGAENLLSMGQEALLNGQTYQAELYFRKTEHVLSNAGFKTAGAKKGLGNT